MRCPTDEEMMVIAKIRGVSHSAVCLAALHGVLAVGVNRGLQAYFLRGRGVLQSRRLDGEEWVIKGKPAKTDTIGTVRGFGISIGLNPNTRRVLVIEGLAGALEAVEVVLRADDEAGECYPGIGVLAAYNADSRLTMKQAKYLAERCVLIAGDSGDRGREAAEAWRDAIRTAGGVRVEAFAADSGDLGDAIKQSPDCPEFIRAFLQSSELQNHQNQQFPRNSP
jgi:hypothetical protein